MNLAQMGLKYGTDPLGRPKLVKMTPTEQEAMMKNYRHVNSGPLRKRMPMPFCW